MVHNQSKYWIAIKANLFRGRACSPWLSPLKATNIQWGDYDNATGLSAITYPISLTGKPFVIITTEGDPAGWDHEINGIAIAGADIVTASNAQANILSKWIISGGAIKRQGQNVRVVIVGI